MISSALQSASNLGLVAALVSVTNPSVTRPVRSPQEARNIAEKATGGLAVSARLVPLNGSTGGWAVDLHMPGEDRGWRCIVDRDSHTIYTRTRIPNPPKPKPRR
jgi:hypothetical protein